MLKFIGSRLRYKTVTIRLGSKKFRAYVADSFLKQMIGLMHRKSLGDWECMLFVFGSNARHGIWMRNMLFPIDTIWIGDKKRVVHIERDMEPCTRLLDCPTYEPVASNRFVVETNSGIARRLGLKIGDEVLGI